MDLEDTLFGMAFGAKVQWLCAVALPHMGRGDDDAVDPDLNGTSSCTFQAATGKARLGARSTEVRLQRHCLS